VTRTRVRVSVERPRCVGAGVCKLTAPEVFDQDDDGVVTVLIEAPEAGHLCPSGAVQASR
jgi:ferredoxin